MPQTFRGYVQGIQAKTGKNPDDFWKLAKKRGFAAPGRAIGKHSDLLAGLKSDLGLGHVHANFIIMYLRLRANDPKLSAGFKKWAYDTGY